MYSATTTIDKNCYLNIENSANISQFQNLQNNNIDINHKNETTMPNYQSNEYLHQQYQYQSDNNIYLNRNEVINKASPTLSTNQDNSQITMNLEDKDLWTRFYGLTNEMILTKAGR
jgi:hypothetical protein